MIPSKTANLPWRQIGTRGVVIHPQRSEVHELDEVGTFLWSVADGATDLEQIVTKLVEEFEIDAARAGADAAEFYAHLESLGLLTCRF